jgi:hypothetical protein
MKKLLVAFALASAAVAGPALAGVGISIQVGEPGFYGQLDIGGYQPRVLYDRPVIVERRARYSSPVYLRVPIGQERNWKRYCGQYRACDQQVYFVRDDWYRNEYAPRYRNQHGRDWRNDRRDDRWERRDDRRDDRHDRRDDRHDQGGRGDNRNDRHDDRRNDGHDGGRNDGRNGGDRGGRGW